MHYGYETARRFAHHSSIQTTAIYDRSIIEEKVLKTVSGILAQTRTGKKYPTMADQERLIAEANELDERKVNPVHLSDAS